MTILLQPEIVPMGEVVSSCVLDMDATIFDSFIGSGEDFDNIEPNPADSSTQTANDFFLGATGTADGDEPSFVGTAGDSAAYFLYGGGDFHKFQGTITTFLDGIHKTTGGSDFSFFMTFRYITGVNQVFVGNRLAGGTNIGVIMFATSTNDVLRCTQRGSSTSSVIGTATMTSGSDIFIGISHSHADNNTRFWVETTTAENVAHTFGTTTSAASGVPSIGGFSDGTLAFPNTSRLYGCSVFNEYFDDAKAAKVKEQYEIRHNRSY